MKQWTIQRSAILVGLTFLGGLMGARTASASHLIMDSPQQVTSAPSGTTQDEMVINGAGDILAFVRSEAGGKSGLYTANVYRPATNYDVTLRTIAGSGLYAHPLLDGDGGVLLFQSTASLSTTPGNPDGSPETFLMRLFNGSVQQLTNNQPFVTPPSLPQPNPAGRVSHASANEDATLIVFSSTADLDTDRTPTNADGNTEIFLYDSIDNEYHQLTDTTGSSTYSLHPVIASMFDPSGTAIAFLSNANLDPSGTAGGNADGSFEVFLVMVQEAVDPCDSPTPPPTCDTVSNTPPRFDPALTDQTINEGQALSMPVTAVDDDFDLVTLSAVIENWTQLGLTSNSLSGIGARFSACDPDVDDTCLEGTGTLTWTPGYDKGAPGGKAYQLRITADDGLDPTSQVVTVTVMDVNRPPTISPSSFGTRIIRVGKNISYAISGSDPDQDALTMTAGSVPAGTTFKLGNSTPGSVTGTISGTLTTIGDYPISVTVQDGRGGQATAIGTLSVVRNQLPVMTTGDITVQEGACVSLMIRGTDADGDPLTYNIDPGTMPANSVFLLGTSTFHWHPDDFNLATPTTPARVTVRFLVSDGIDVVTKDITITVTDTPLDQVVFSAGPVGTIVVAPGSTVSVSVTVKNTGVTSWTASDGYALVANYVTPGMPTPAPVPLAPGETIQPGQLKTFTVILQAPSGSGLYYYTNYRMSKAGVPFGPTSNYVAILTQ